MNDNEQLKVIIAITSALVSYNYITKTKKDLTIQDKEKYYMIFLVRMIIVMNSIRYNWPIEVCSTTNAVLTVLSIKSSQL